MRISDWSSDVCSSDLAGCDGDFGKGGNLYDRGNGDPSVTLNPCLGPIAKPPFYAVAVLPTPLGTSCGLSADVHARVLDAPGAARSDEQTSELQSLMPISYAVICMKTNNNYMQKHITSWKPRTRLS